MGKKNKSKNSRSGRAGGNHKKGQKVVGGSGGPATADSLHASIENAEKLLEQGNVAMDLGKPMAALNIFDAASIMCRKLQKAQENIFGMSFSKLDILSARIQCQIGEAHASMGDVESAKSEFQKGLTNFNSESKEEGSKLPDIVLSNDNETLIKDLQQREELHDVRAGLHMYIAQISEGFEALSSYEEGSSNVMKRLEILQQLKDIVPGTPLPMDEDETQTNQENTTPMLDVDASISDAKKTLCKMHCAKAELYMTDLCMEDDAEERCERAIQKALQQCDGAENEDYDCAPVEVLQAMANLRLSQSRLDDGTRCILAAYQKMQKGCQALASMVGFGNEDDEIEDLSSREAQELMNTDDVMELPGQEFRVQTAKLLLECANSLNAPLPNMQGSEQAIATSDSEIDSSTKVLVNQCAEASLQALGSLLAENDEVIEVWYLVGSAAMALCPSNPDMALHHWSRALEMLEACRDQLEQTRAVRMTDEEEVSIDEDEIDMIQNQIDDVKERVKEAESALEAKAEH